MRSPRRSGSGRRPARARSLPGGLLFLGLLVVFGAAARARADSDGALRVRTVWTTDLACPSAGALEAEVERILRRPVFDPDAEAMISVAVEDTGAGLLRVRVLLLGANGEVLGERPFQKAFRDCEELLGALGVVAALLVDYRMQEETPIATPNPSVETPPRVAPPASRTRLGVAAHASLALAHGILPAAGAGVLAGVTIAAGPRARIALGVGTFASQTTDPVRTSSVAGAAGVFSTLTLPLLGCALPLATPRLETGLCGGITAGVVQGTGTQVETPETRTRVFLTPTVGLVVSLRLVGPLVARFEATAGIAVVRSPFFVELGTERVEIFTPRRFQAGTALGLGLQSW